MDEKYLFDPKVILFHLEIKFQTSSCFIPRESNVPSLKVDKFLKLHQQSSGEHHPGTRPRNRNGGNR